LRERGFFLFHQKASDVISLSSRSVTSSVVDATGTRVCVPSLQLLGAVASLALGARKAALFLVTSLSLGTRMEDSAGRKGEERS